MPAAPHIARSPAILGLAEGIRPELVDFGAKNLRAENVRQFAEGEARTRFGFSALAAGLIDGTTPTAGYKMFADRDTALRICDGTAQVYDAVSAKWKALPGRMPEAAARLIDLPSMGTASRIEDVSYANGYFCIAWQVSVSGNTASWGNCYSFAALVNATTGALVSAPVQVTTIANDYGPRVLAVGSKFIFVRASPSGNTVQAQYLDTTSAATITTGWVAMTNLATDLNISGVIGACALPHATLARAAVAYMNSSGGTSQLTVKTFDSTGVLEAQTINTSSVLPTVVDCEGDALDTLWVSWNETLDVKMRGLPPLAITTTALATTATIITAAATPGNIGIQHSTSAAGKGRLLVNDSMTPMRMLLRGFQTTAGAAAANGSQITVYSAWACGRPFTYASRYYVPVYVADTANLQQQVVYVDWTDDVQSLRPVAVPTSGLCPIGASGQPLAFKCSTVAGPTSSKLYSGVGIIRSGVADASALLEMDFLSSRRWQPAAWGNSTYISGGVVSSSDGAKVVEVGFLSRPPIPTTGTSGTGISCSTGWRYVCVYEQVDADGNWHQSGISTPSVSTGAVTDKTVTVTTNPLSVSSRLSSTSSQAGGVRVAFYRTLDGGTAPYYRLGTTINNTAASTVTYADTTTDLLLAARAKLYSQPGVIGTAQDKRPPPPFQCITSYSGMLVGASGSDVWYSGQNVSGEGVWFNPIFQVPVPGYGDITALWAMDGTLFVAKRSEIYAIAGEPPADNGSSGGLGVPRRLSVDVGCIESRSVCITSMGVFFQSDRGIEILTRAQSVVWVGKRVQDTLAAYPVVTSATLDPSNSGRVYVECAASEASGLVSGSGRTLVFDVEANEWIGTDRRKSAAAVADCPSQSACIIYTGTVYRYAWMDSTGRVHYEDRTKYTDADGSFVVPLIETGWVNAYQNEQEVRSLALIFQRYTAAGLKVEVAYNYGDYVVLDNKVWTELNTVGQRQLELSPRPVGGVRPETMKFRITATAPTTIGTGQGFGIFGLTLDLMAKQGPTKGTTRLDPALRR